MTAKCEPSGSYAFEAFSSVDFNSTRQLPSIWSNPTFHVSSLHRESADEILKYFLSRTRIDLPEPLGKVVVGPAGFGKTHLVGELRRRVLEENGWFVLFDSLGVQDFWSSVALGFLNSIQMCTPDGRAQYIKLIDDLIDILKIKRDFDRRKSWNNVTKEELSRVSTLFLTKLKKIDQARTLEHGHVLIALLLLASNDIYYQNVAHGWLQGMEIDPEIVNPLGNLRKNEPIKVVKGLSWLVGFCGARSNCG